MTFSDKLAVWSLIVTVLGFSVTIWQLIRTANASVATKKAIEETARRMSLNHLLVLLPQLRMIEGDLDAAAADNDKKLAVRSLVSYSHTANQVASLLEGEGTNVDQAMVERLRTSAKTAGAAKSALVSGSGGASVKSVTKAAIEQVGEVSSHAAGLIAQYQVKAS